MSERGPGRAAVNMVHWAALKFPVHIRAGSSVLSRRLSKAAASRWSRGGVVLVTMCWSSWRAAVRTAVEAECWQVCIQWSAESGREQRSHDRAEVCSIVPGVSLGSLALLPPCHPLSHRRRTSTARWALIIWKLELRPL